MPSIVFTVPRHIQPNLVMTWAPGVLFVHNVPLHLRKSEYVYICHRNHILYRARYQESVWLYHKVTTEGEDRGSGWALKVGESELPPHKIIRQSSHGFRYLYQRELW